MAPLRRIAPLAFLSAALLVLAWWRIDCIRSGWDVDTDAYAHHMIARAILADPTDMRVHWVWLPLFHYAQAGLVFLGGTMNAVRYINTVAVVGTAILLFRFVTKTTVREGNSLATSVVPILAALLFAADPIVMEMGTTAEPEPIFCLLIVGVAITFQESKYLTAAVLLAFAAMLRYEAWAVLAALACILAFESFLRFRRGERSILTLLPPPRAWAMLALPAVVILTWAAIRRPSDGAWFAFLKQTREFANDATKAKSALDLGPLRALGDLLWYPLGVPGRVLGPTLLLAPFGVLRTVRVQGPRFVLVFLACLGMVTLSWLTRSSLGLLRHFVVVVPLYATFISNGVVTLTDATYRAIRRKSDLSALWASRVAALAMVGLAVVPPIPILALWMRDVHGSIDRGWPDRVRMGDYLREHAGEKTVFCDDATVEIISGLPRTRFDRHWMDDAATWTLIEEAAAREGEVFVATWARKLVPFRAEGEVVFRADPKGPQDQGLAIMRVVAKGK